MFRPRPRLAALVSSSAVLSLTLAVACSDGRGPITGPIVDPDGGAGDGGLVGDAGELVPSLDLCGDGVDQDLDGEADDACNRVFVTSTPASLASLAAGGDVLGAADAHCGALAADAGLDGTFVAFLSTKVTSVVSRIGDARGFVRVDGRPIAETAAELVNGDFRYPIALTEQGEAVSVTVATASGSDGDFVTAYGCANFTNFAAENTIASGRAHASSHLFGNGVYPSCAGEHYLYCVETDHDTPLAPAVRPGADAHVAFLSASALVPGAGIAAADAICEAEAVAAELAGEFVALLPTKGVAPIGRIVSDGRPIARVDGVVIADSEEAFAALEWQAPIAREADGVTVANGNYAVWVAAEAPDVLSSGSCLAFSDASADSEALIWRAGLPWTEPATSTFLCDFTHGRVYCVSR